MNALPALQTVYYDGWVLRFADGYTRRSNSVNPVYPSLLDIDEKIEYCERLYRSRGLKVIFKLTDAVYPENLDVILEQKKYEIETPVSIQILDLNWMTVRPDIAIIRTEKWSENWQREFFRISNLDSCHFPKLREMLSGIIPRKCFFSIVRDGSVATCGLAVMEREYVGLFDIVTDPIFRRQGLGARISLDMLEWGKELGASKAYLQVMVDNKPAIKLYEKIGFAEVYKYWYRVKD